MMVRVGVIGPASFLERLKELDSHVSNIAIVPYVYRRPRDAKQIVEQASGCDVLFFAGLLPMTFAKEVLKQKRTPYMVLPLQELNVMLSIFHVLYHHGVNLSKLSIDVIERETVEAVFRELQMEMPDYVTDFIYTLEHSPEDFAIDEIYEQHVRLFEQGRIQFVLTSIDAVEKKLIEKGIPCMAMIDPESSLISGLEHARALGELQQSKQSQTAVAMVAFHEQVDRDILHSLGKLLSSTFQEGEDKHYLFYTTRGSVEQLTDRLTAFSGEGSPSLAVGFGFGLTLKDAKANAVTALTLAQKEQSKTSAYVVTSDKEVIGPLDSKRKHYLTQTQDEQLLRAAKQSNISIANVQKIIAFNASRPQRGFTSHDLAEYLEVSRRSAERLLKKLYDQRFVEVIGEETPYQQGRPRAVYQLNLYESQHQ